MFCLSFILEGPLLNTNYKAIIFSVSNLSNLIIHRQQIDLQGKLRAPKLKYSSRIQLYQPKIQSERRHVENSPGGQEHRARGFRQWLLGYFWTEINQQKVKGEAQGNREHLWHDIDQNSWRMEGEMCRQKIGQDWLWGDGGRGCYFGSGTMDVVHKNKAVTLESTRSQHRCRRNGV